MHRMHIGKGFFRYGAHETVFICSALKPSKIDIRFRDNFDYNNVLTINYQLLLFLNNYP